MLLPAVFHENLFDDWFDPFFEDMDRELDRGSRQVFGKRGANMMKTDVKKEDVKMELDNGYLTIQAVRSHSNEEKDKQGRYVRRESFSGTCARSFYVGEDVKKEDVRAKFEDGVLKITLPHPQTEKELPAANTNLIEIE